MIGWDKKCEALFSDWPPYFVKFILILLSLESLCKMLIYKIQWSLKFICFTIDVIGGQPGKLN